MQALLTDENADVPATPMAISVTPVKLVADRGRISMKSVTVSTNTPGNYRVRGKWDLVSQEGGVRVSDAPVKAASGN
ncbi:hypothetical protein CS022_14540 [Veronia nyctiphanis]|uniref:Uncharacterized protein n=1 Tax=Veronia nyctiphanis TaxID=1278244 RepID=A0A4Q0YNV6_9GAMM|nr:hypothetical protein [Veronia nyctiphanis]RXJ72652.1 hypothetical protein CS022_14540 [Veronia nyctiphanis]